jgi:hypothetical protein
VLAEVFWVRLVQGDDGPVIVPMPEPLNPPTAPIATSDAWLVVAVAVEDQDVAPASFIWLAVLSAGLERTIPAHSITMISTEVAAGLNDTATAVCPPEQFGSAHICVVRVLVEATPAVST